MMCEWELQEQNTKGVAIQNILKKYKIAIVGGGGVIHRK
jgi:aromatic ring-opening dioxygenase catalytic subunit (LigB family)